MDTDEGAKYDPGQPDGFYLFRIVRELMTIRTLIAEGINDMRKAESEVPEFMRRFANYMHDLHSIRYMYEEQGHPPPPWVLREMERIHDRYRQLLRELHLDDGVFEKVRREMAKDSENRYDHTRLLYPPKEAPNETGPSVEKRNGGGET